MVTLMSGIILDQNDDGPLKWANGPYPIQIHADYIIFMGLLFYGPFAKFDGPKNPYYLCKSIMDMSFEKLIYEAQLS